MRLANFAKTLPAFALSVAGALGLQSCGFGERNDVLILIRAGDGISKSIADYYAEARAIPANRILELEFSSAADHDEIDAATFSSEIVAPIESYLAVEDPENEISILVTTRGIPIRIGHCDQDRMHYPRNCRSSAVDASLAGLGRLSSRLKTIGEDDGLLLSTGPLDGNENPFFGDPRSFEEFREDEPDSKLRFLVGRLSGPPVLDDSGSPVPVALRHLIDQTTRVDATDSRFWKIYASAPPALRDAASAALLEPIHQLFSRSSDRLCDGCESFAESPLPSGVVLQQTPAADSGDRLPERLAYPGLVIALGSPENDLEFFHRTLEFWLSRGALAISMHLGDPSLGGVTRPAIQLRAWTDGRPAIEAHFKSVPHLGWTNIFVGDPLLALANPDPVERGDRDGDGIPDRMDNCLDVVNPNQRDSNGDGLGNRCDPDVNDDGRIDTSWGQIYPVDRRGDLEIIALTARNGPHDPDHDLDGDGRVDDRDLALAQLWLFRRPGPTGSR